MHVIHSALDVDIRPSLCMEGGSGRVHQQTLLAQPTAPRPALSGLQTPHLRPAKSKAKINDLLAQLAPGSPISPSLAPTPLSSLQYSHQTPRHFFWAGEKDGHQIGIAPSLGSLSLENRSRKPHDAKYGKNQACALDV